MAIFATSFSFIILMIFMGFKFMILGKSAVNLMMTLTMLLFSLMMLSFLLAICLVGQMTRSEVRKKFKKLSSNLKQKKL